MAPRTVLGWCRLGRGRVKRGHSLQGTEKKECAIRQLSPDCRDERKTNVRLAHAVATHFQAVANQTLFVMARHCRSATARVFGGFCLDPIPFARS
jgi:hypothetical protein